MWRFDRGLTPEEQDAFFDWLAQDPSHSASFSTCRRHWKRLDNLANWLPEHSEKPNPDLLAPRSKPKILKRIPLILATAAVLVLSFQFWSTWFSNFNSEDGSAQVAEEENRTTLQDGSVVKLKDDAEITVLFTDKERRVRLEKGEAFFMVAHDPSKPFVVEVKGNDVSALGTAFNVRLDNESFEVLVSEGVVEVSSSRESYDEEVAKLDKIQASRLEANQRAVVSLLPDHEIPEIATLTKGEIQRVLAWQHGLMTFHAQPLSEIAYELNHFNETQIFVL
ncbi:MAG: FecR domain-containing protein, partial [Verrucomicrobiae bacterium]|nr:FecR domain-containing protein [Verrucomicrobiae bacterium]